MSTKREKYAEISIDINEFEKNLDQVLSESKVAPVAILKDGSALYYCIPADTFVGLRVCYY